MTAVIYARYSSDNQREESIEGQIRECTAFAEKNGITVVKHYIDRAFSAKTDNRPEFQQMIKDSGKKLFDVVLVWKFDRFARNRFDSANYKMILKKNGVHLIIVPKDLFDRVQKRLDKNKRAPACGKADEEYLLTTKLFCGKCGALMFGESGTSATGRTYYYYKCANVKRRKGCNKKTVQKEWLEDLVVRETMKLIQDDAVIDKIVQLVMDVQNQENTTIPLLEKQLREVNKKLDNLMKAIEDGLYTRTTKERLEALEIQKDELTAKIADEKLKKPSFNEDFIRFWLMKFRKFDISQKKQRKALIEIFVNAIFLYDDRMLITFNYKDGTQTVRFEDTLTADGVEGKSSDLSSLAGSGQRSHRCQADLAGTGSSRRSRGLGGCLQGAGRRVRYHKINAKGVLPGRSSVTELPFCFINLSPKVCRAAGK